MLFIKRNTALLFLGLNKYIYMCRNILKEMPYIKRLNVVVIKEFTDKEGMDMVVVAEVGDLFLEKSTLSLRSGWKVLKMMILKMMILKMMILTIGTKQ